MKNYLSKVVMLLIALVVGLGVQDVYSESEYTINYYVGNGATTKGVTQIGTSTCEYGKECQLKLFETLLSETESGVSSFPLPSRQWSFYGWVKEEQKNSELENIDYIDGDKFTINLDDIQNDILNVYAIGKREFIFWSGISPTNGEDRVMQYWNPYLRSTTYVSIVSIPKATEIPSWEFLGYRANDDVTADVTIAGDKTSLKADPYSYTDLFFRSKYQRQLTLKYNANGGSGSLISDSQMQYYSSGIGVDGKNEGAKISTASTWILLNNQYTRNGYVFYGWGETPNDEDANGPGVHYGYFYPGVSDNSTKEIYAIWKEESKYGRIVGRYGSYENAIKIVKELMRDYFVKGPLIKYNSAKKTYGIDNPEEATSQDTMYKTCTGYTYSVYVEAFGMNRSVDNFVRGSFEILDVARDYYNAHKNNLESLNGNYLLYYEKKGTTDKYVYDNKENINDFIELLRPGDILVYTGHGLIVYDKVKKSDGTWDILILNAVNEGEIRSRNYGTSKLYYSINTLSTGFSRIIHLDNVGTIKPLMMKNSQFVTDDKLSCKQTECAIIRPFYNDDGYANFNYSILKSYYDKSMLRVKYPNLTIEKTVDKGDNNSVYLNDTLSYKIKLTNNSNFFEDDNTIAEVSGYLNEDGSYKDNLIVEEDLGEYISYVDSSIDAIINNESVVGNGVVVQYDSQNKKIRWTIDGSALKQGKNNSIELVFKVKVPQNYSFIDKKIEATGKIYNSLDANVYITTGTVLNTIIPKVSEYQMSYNECFNSLKDNFEGLELINQIYKCSNNVDLKLDEFDFENVIGGINQDEPEYAQLKTKFLREYPNTVYLKDNNVYKKMILNNYWNKQLELKLDSNKLFLHLPRYSGEQSKYRAKTINSIDFKNGDVLIYYVKYIQNDNRFKNLSDTELGKVSDATYRKKYTNEDGIYAFIYLDGKFIGRNYTGEANERNEFTYEYYIKDLTDDTEKLAALKDNLYSAASLSNVEVLKYVNYQSLYDKNDYVILRPESSIEQVDSIVINSEPQKKDYYAGESLNLDGIDVSATYNNGKQESAPISDLVISGYSSIVGNQTVTIEYKGKTAEFNVNVTKINVSFNSNGGSNVASQTIDYNGKATKPSNPTKEGYTFVEWQLNGETYDFDTVITGDITLTALWTINRYIVTFDANGGAHTTMEGGNSILVQFTETNGTVLKPVDPERIGYTFVEWQLNGEVFDFNTVITGDITLTAAWSINKYTVSFNSDGGSNVASQTIDYNGKATKPSNPTKEGYTFVEWQLNGETYDFDTVITGDITLTAAWSINKYTVSFNCNGGSAVESQTVDYNGKATKPSNPTKEGYTFVEWQLNEQTYDFNTPVTSNITLTALWEENVEPQDVSLKNVLESNGYSINNNYVSKIAIGTTVSQMKNVLGDDIIIESQTDIISTGAVIKRDNESYTVVIKGDINKDGKIGALDYIAIRNHMIGTNIMNSNSIDFLASDMNSDEKISALDYIAIRNIMMGK